MLLDGSPSPILPISIPSSHRAPEFWFSHGKREYQAGSNMKIKQPIAWSKLKFKIQTASSSAWREDGPATGWGAACQAGMQPVQGCVQPGWQWCPSAGAPCPLWIRARSLQRLMEPLELLSRPLYLCKCRARLKMEILKMWFIFTGDIPAEYSQ